MTLPEDDQLAPPTRGDAALPELEDPPIKADDAAIAELRSLRDDVEALIEDGKTYLETELVFQKTRAAFVADRAKGAVMYGAIAAFLAVLALIGLAVGLIIALAPLLTAWGSSAVVVGALLVGAFIFVRMASSRWNSLMSAIQAEREP